jgi:hypothetical protein
MSDRAELLARHVSLDGALVWRVERETEAEGRVTISCGFEGLPWHLHPDQFEPHGRSAEQIAADLTAGVLGDRHLIVTDGPEGARIRRWLLTDLELEGLAEDSSSSDHEYRFWSGRRVELAELIAGTVATVPLVFG